MTATPNHGPNSAQNPSFSARDRAEAMVRERWPLCGHDDDELYHLRWQTVELLKSAISDGINAAVGHLHPRWDDDECPLALAAHQHLSRAAGIAAVLVAARNADCYELHPSDVAAAADVLVDEISAARKIIIDTLRETIVFARRNRLGGR